MKKAIAAILTGTVIISSLLLPAQADIIKGDVNGDGKVTSADSLLVQRSAIGLKKLNDRQNEAADFNVDGKVTIIDALYILREAVNLGTNKPVINEPTTDEPTTDEPTTDEPTSDEPVDDKSTPNVTDVDKSDTDIPVTDEPDTDVTDTDTPVTDEPDTDVTDTDTPDTDETDTDVTDTDNNDKKEPMLYLPPQITINCGDRTTLNPKVINGSDEGLTYYFDYDGAISYDGTGETVLEVSYASGLLKGYHPGTDHVVVTASNGLTAECDVTVVNNKTVKTIHVGDHTLKVTKEIMIYNDCYSQSYDFTNIFGLVVHSTAEPGKMADYWYPKWNKGGTPACVHAFLDDKGVYQYLPFEQRGWHAGYPVNDTRIDFEICEPAGFYYDENWEITDYDVKKQQAYFDKIWENATVFSAYLVYKYGFDEENIISHYEAGQLGIGTNHKDPDHWFILHGKTMDDFREDVWKLLEEDIYETEEVIIGSLE